MRLVSMGSMLREGSFIGEVLRGESESFLHSDGGGIKG